MQVRMFVSHHLTCIYVIEEQIAEESEIRSLALQTWLVWSFICSCLLDFFLCQSMCHVFNGTWIGELGGNKDVTIARRNTAI